MYLKKVPGVQFIQAGRDVFWFYQDEGVTDKAPPWGTRSRVHPLSKEIVKDLASEHPGPKDWSLEQDSSQLHWNLDHHMGIQECDNGKRESKVTPQAS